MYRPPHFREERPDVLREIARTYPLATLVTYGASGLTANLVPFILTVDQCGRDVLRAHVVKGNEQIADLREGAETLVIFKGPQAYITPAWYPTKREHGKVVPTWNYIVVQMWGRPQVIEETQWLLAQISDLTAAQEQGRSEPWSVGDAPAEFLASQIKGIIGLEIPIDRIEGKWKVSQNQPAINRAGVVAGLRELDASCPMAAIVGLKV